MQNCTDSGTPQRTWMFPLHDIAIKVVKCTKYEIKAYHFFGFVVYSHNFKFFFYSMS